MYINCDKHSKEFSVHKLLKMLNVPHFQELFCNKFNLLHILSIWIYVNQALLMWNLWITWNLINLYKCKHFFLDYGAMPVMRKEREQLIPRKLAWVTSIQTKFPLLAFNHLRSQYNLAQKHIFLFILTWKQLA